MTLTVPEDFQISTQAGALTHKPSGMVYYINQAIVPNQAEIDYMVHKYRIEHRRNRLWRMTGEDALKYRDAALELRKRGRLI